MVEEEIGIELLVVTIRAIYSQYLLPHTLSSSSEKYNLYAS